MKILGLELSTREGSLAVADGEKVVIEEILPAGKSSSSSIMPVLNKSLQMASIKLNELDGIAVGVGPGSFTGIRLGLAVAKGLAIALDIPVRGVCGFDMLLGDYKGKAYRVCPLISAHSYGLYAALYERDGSDYKRTIEPFVCQPDELPKRINGELLFLGPDLDRFRGILKGIFAGRASFDRKDVFPRASAAARLYASPRAIHDKPPDGVNLIYILPGARKRGHRT